MVVREIGGNEKKKKETREGEFMDMNNSMVIMGVREVEKDTEGINGARKTKLN